MNVKTKELLILITAVILSTIGVLFLLFYKEEPNIVINIPKKDVATATIPIIEKPEKQSTTTEVELLSTENLITKPYIPSENVYTTDYEKESIRLAINGSFNVLKIKMNGEVMGEGKHFISFSIDEISGIINGVRSSANELNVDATNDLGGIYNKGDKIELEIDLFGDTIFSTTKEEYIETRRPSKVIKIWYVIDEPPSIINFLFAPFNEWGKYGGVMINSIEVEYLCEEGDECTVKSCDKEILYTECLRDNFGLISAKDWCDRKKIKGCENLR